MTYFSNLPSIYYDYNINGVNEVRVIRDISTNMRFKKELLDNITLYDEYDIMDGETPDIISERIYGTPHYHWIIMLLNDRFDYINDFPLSISQLQQHVIDTYGAGNKLGIHHYVDTNGYILSSVDSYYDPYVANRTILCSLTLNSTTVTSVTTNAFAEINTGKREFQISGAGIPSNSIVKIISFIDNSTCVINAPAEATMQSELTTISMINPMTGASAVTNFDYEVTVNESKRRIKLLHPSIIPTVLTQLRAING